MSILALAIVGGLTLGCQPGVPVTPAPGESATPPPPTGAPEPTLVPPSGAPGAVVPPEAEKAIQLARADLARRLGLKTEAIAVTSVEAVEWPSTALGCPQPGMMYAQVITPGYRVTLRVAAGGERYEYHTDRGAHAVLCEQEARAGATPAPTADLADPGARRAAELARADLAQRLGLATDEITVVKVEIAPWSDAWLGCPQPPGKQPDRAYPDEPPTRPGYRITLCVAAQGVRYEYRSDGRRVIFCGVLQPA